MAASLPAIKVLLITDSRGNFLQGYLNNHNRDHNAISYQVEVHKGSRIGRLWRFAHQYCLKNSYDLIYILGGICDVTAKQYIEGRKVYWPPGHHGLLGMILVNEINRITDEYLMMQPHPLTKLCIVPEVGGDFIKYNFAPLTEENIGKQPAIELSMANLRDAAKLANRCMNVTTPWIIDTVYCRNKRGNLVPKYHRLDDGIHPSPRTAEKAAITYIKHAHEYFLLPKPHLGPLINELH